MLRRHLLLGRMAYIPKERVGDLSLLRIKPWGKGIMTCLSVDGSIFCCPLRKGLTAQPLNAYTFESLTYELANSVKRPVGQWGSVPREPLSSLCERWFTNWSSIFLLKKSHTNFYESGEKEPRGTAHIFWSDLSVMFSPTSQFVQFLPPHMCLEERKESAVIWNGWKHCCFLFIRKMIPCWDYF